MRNRRRSECQGPEEGQGSPFKELRLDHRERGEGNLRSSSRLRPVEGEGPGVGLAGCWQGDNCPPPLKHIDCPLLFQMLFWVFQESRGWRGSSRYEPLHTQEKAELSGGRVPEGK